MGQSYPEHPFSDPTIRRGSIIAFVERGKRFYCKFEIEERRCWARVVNPPDGSSRIDAGSDIALTETLTAQYWFGDGQAWAVLQFANFAWRKEDWYRVLFMHNPDLTAELDALAHIGPANGQTIYGEGA